MKGKKKKKKSTKVSGDDLLAELRKGDYIQEWHLKFGSLLYAVFFGFVFLAVTKRSTVGLISLTVGYFAVIWFLGRTYRDPDK